MTPTSLLPAVPMPAGVSLPADAGNTAGALAFIQAAGQAVAYTKNQQLAQEYLTGAFPSWLQRYQARNADESQIPQPPAGYMVQMNDGGWTWVLLQVGPPVCAVPQYQKITPLPPGTGHVHVGHPISGTAYYSTGIDDTAPADFVTPPVTADDGAEGIWKKVSYPFGGWYLTQQILKQGGA